MMLPEAVDPDDRAVDEEVGRPAEEGDATLPEVLPVPESLAEARRNELERWRFDSAKCMDITWISSKGKANVISLIIMAIIIRRTVASVKKLTKWRAVF